MTSMVTSLSQFMADSLIKGGSVAVPFSSVTFNRDGAKVKQGYEYHVT